MEPREQAIEWEYTWEEAFDIAVEMFGYPCSCEGCVIKNGPDCSEQVFAMTRELSGQEYPPEGWRG